MQNASKQNSLQEILGNTLMQLTSNVLQSFKPLMGMMPDSTCNCCPPERKCPPHCIAHISRVAAQGERIVVPFIVKNTCSQTKTYRVGVRELKDQDGKPAPFQPQLNKQSVTVEPGRSEQVMMTVDLIKFTNGSTYDTEIVLREKEINQNICFTLEIDNGHDIVTAQPQDEKQHLLRWQSWQSHYYCEPKPRRINQ